MMPSRVPCVSTENPLGLSWHDSSLVPMLNATNVLDYFCERSNPFYDRTCNNEIIKMQRSNPEQLTNMTGVEYFLLHAQEPILYVIRKQARQSPTQAHPLADYYIIAGTVYQAPDLVSVINSRLLTSVFQLESAFDDLFTMMRYQPSKGYSWDIKSQSSAAGILKKDVKEEPSSNFQRQRVDMLLMELTKRFPLPVIRPPIQEVENVPEPQPSRSEPATVVKTEKMEEGTAVKEEKVESVATSPSMKPPPEKKARLN